MLSRRLARKGYDVAIATDGQRGIDMAASENSDLNLMDMSLPVIEGMSRRLLKFVEQALLVKQATQPWRSVQGQG